MICERCNSRLSAYIDGKLSTSDVQQLNHHLAGCRRCREDLRELQTMRRLLRSLPEPAAREEFWDSALRTARLRKPRMVRPIAFATATGIAAAALFLASLLLMRQPGVDLVVPSAKPQSALLISPASLITLHTRERARSPLADIGKVRVAGSDAEAADLADNGRFDVQ